MKTPLPACDIFVHTPSNVYSLKQVPTSIPILQLKARIELRTGIPVEYQLLSLSGCALEDDSLMFDTNIRRGSVLRLFFATKIAGKLFELTNIEDFVGLLNSGVQVIDLSEAPSYNDKNRLIAWNRDARQRAFFAVCIACFNGSLQLLANLLKHCAFDLNQVTLWGRSALHFAAVRGSIGCVCLLLDKGIDPCIQDEDGKTAQDIATEYGHVHCKRRIWLYRWNIKPTLKSDKKRPCVEEREEVRFPALGVSITPSPSVASFHEDQYLQEDVLPTVHYKKSANTFAKAHNTSLEAKQPLARSRSAETFERYQMDLTQMDRPNSVSSLSSDEVTVMEQIKAQGEHTKRDESETKDDQELQLLLRLADKYGYTIVESKKPVEQENGQNDAGASDEICSEKSVQEVAKSRMKQTRVSPEEIDDMDSKKNNFESHRRNKTSIRRISLTAKTNNSKKPLAGMSGSAVEKQKSDEVNDRITAIASVTDEIPRNNGISRNSGIPRNKQAQPAVPNDKLETNRSSNPTLKLSNRSDSAPENIGSENKREDDERNEEEPRLGRMEIRTGMDSTKRDSKSTFQQWLDRKSKQKRDSSSTESGQKNEREKRQDLCGQAFRNWLQLKRVRYRSASVSPRMSHSDLNREVSRPKSGLSFETWIKKKRKVQPRSSSFTETKGHEPVKRAYSSGVTYSEWIESKKRQLEKAPEDADEANGNDGRPQSRARVSGMTFENWVESKTRQEQIERVQQETDKMRAEYEREMENESKMKNRNVKTFEEWQLEKKFEDRVRKAKQKKEQRSVRKNKVKFEEDSKLVYNMWLMNKHLTEMEKEEQHSSELREEWEKKKKAQLKLGARNPAVVSL